MAKREPSKTPTPASAQPVSLSVLKPAQVVQHFNDDEWEAFVLEALGAMDPPYARIERRGGAGDKGRDVMAHLDGGLQAGQCDLYQCKAYSKPLGMGNVWTELGKLCVYTYLGTYPVPRRYRFAAPHGVTTPLGNLLDKPTELKQELIERWPQHCESSISQGTTYPLDGDLKAYVEAFDFNIVHYHPLNELLDLHRKTKHWHTRFKRDYPTRPKSPTPPPEPQPHEMRYVRHLLDAYGEYRNVEMTDVRALDSDQQLSKHFQGCRTDFFMADGLNRFYRDAQFPGAFEHVKDQVEQGVRNILLSDHPHAYQRLCQTLSQASVLPLAKTDYEYCVMPGDKQGLCHHLANDDRLSWVQP